ncbi:MAG: hypothetical protein SFV52_03895 [Saprospiraceae bacterium]|nr:hypothetical protein [Saprospiraceae bacterium]
MTILILSPFYAPYIHPRAHRWTAIAEYWAASGHRVLVVTARVHGRPLLENLHGVEVRRVGFDSLKGLLVSLAPVLPTRGIPDNRAPEGAGWWWRWLAFLYQQGWRKLCFPDDALFWRKPAFAAASRIVQTLAVDVVVSVSLPITAHRVGLDLQTRFRLPWLADVGDPFAAPGWEISNPVLYGMRSRGLEQRLLGAADGVVVTGEKLKAWLVQQYGLDRVWVVPPLLHPVPENDVMPFQQGIKSPYRFGYFGAFYPLIREPYAMLELFRRFHLGGLDFTLHIYGEPLPGYLSLFKRYHWVQVHGLRPREETQRKMSEMDVLVNVGNKNPFLLPSKAVSYLAAERPILHIQDLSGDAFMDFVAPYGRTLRLSPDMPNALQTLLDWLTGAAHSGTLFRTEPFAVEAVGQAYLRVISHLQKSQREDA